MARKIRLHSPYAPIPLAEKLKKEMKRKWTKEEKKNGRVMGNGTESDMSLRFQRWRSRNDFSTRLTATMKAKRGGTIIEGKMGTARSVSIFMIFWLGFVGFFLLMALIVVFSSDDAPFMFKAMFTGIPAVMFIFGLLLLKLGRRNAPQDEKKILAFLAEIAKAREERSS